MIRTHISFIFLFCLGIVQGQQTSNDLAEAEAMFDRKHYAGAFKFYQTKINKGQANGNIYYKAGVCYLNSRSQKHKAAPLLEKAISESTSFYTHGLAKETDAPMDVYLLLGDAYRYQYKFSEAIGSYEKYLLRLKENKKSDVAAIKLTEARIASARFDADLKETFSLPPNFKLASIEKNGEDAVGEFNSSLSADNKHMIDTLKVPVERIRKYEDEKYFETIPNLKTEIPAEPAKPVAQNKNKKSATDFQQDTVVNITTVGTSLDGQVMITYKDDGGEANLYMQRLIANQWSKPVKLAKTANLKGWEPQEFMSPDGSLLYFSSDRPGGYGGMDIYRCKKLPNGEWSKAVNLGPDINSAYHDEAPFLHPDGQTLLYSSNRIKPTVTYDIFASKISGDAWSKAQVVGYPINSSEDNSFYQVAVEKKKLLAENSAKSGKDKKPEKEEPAKSKGKKEVKQLSDSLVLEQKTGEHALVTFESQYKNNLHLLKGTVNAKKGKKSSAPLEADIKLVNNSKDQVMNIFKSDRAGRFSCIMSPDANTAVVYEAPGYLFCSQNYYLSSAEKNAGVGQGQVILQPFEEGSSTRLNNIFFEGETNKLAPASLPELNRVFELLHNNPGLNIRLTNYIFTPDKSYTGLSVERAEAVKNYLIEKGIAKKRIKTKGERPKSLPKNEQPELVAEKDPKPVQRMELQIEELKN